MFGIFLFREYTNTTWRYAIVHIRLGLHPGSSVYRAGVPSCIAAAVRMVLLCCYLTERLLVVQDQNPAGHHDLALLRRDSPAGIIFQHSPWHLSLLGCQPQRSRA